ncbi:unnamed protein product [Trifolium pratense]|uniref:Uncharacterized protein n=1 Tax=Trifolium pratense TaxID=57577 RepID=A0ACB0J5K9_TRIPR|nr:unnamed protein product [Trifolium pratense]
MNFSFKLAFLLVIFVISSDMCIESEARLGGVVDSAHRFHLFVKKESHQFPNPIPSTFSNSFSHPPSRPSQPPPPVRSGRVRDFPAGDREFQPWKRVPIDIESSGGVSR